MKRTIASDFTPSSVKTLRRNWISAVALDTIVENVVLSMETYKVCWSQYCLIKKDFGAWQDFSMSPNFGDIEKLLKPPNVS